MHPTLFTWHGLGIHTWGTMVTIAFVVPCLVAGLRAGKVGIDPDRLVPIWLIAPAAGLIGARLLHFLMAERGLLWEDPAAFFDLGQGGFAFYGGVILGSAACLTYAAFARIPLLKLIDVVAPTVMLGLGFGRIGCFFAGCCHGRACPAPVSATVASFQGGAIVSLEQSPWLALIFKKGVGVGAIFNHPVYPTQLWESAGAFVLFFALSAMWRWGRRFDGQVAAAMLVLYAILRFTIEGFRGDTIRGVEYLGRFSTSQMVSFPMLALGLGLALYCFRRGVAPEQPYRPSDED